MTEVQVPSIENSPDMTGTPTKDPVEEHVSSEIHQPISSLKKDTSVEESLAQTSEHVIDTNEEKDINAIGENQTQSSPTEVSMDEPFLTPLEPEDAENTPAIKYDNEPPEESVTKSLVSDKANSPSDTPTVEETPLPTNQDTTSTLPSEADKTQAVYEPVTTTKIDLQTPEDKIESHNENGTPLSADETENNQEEVDQAVFAKEVIPASVEEPLTEMEVASPSVVQSPEPINETNAEYSTLNKTNLQNEASATKGKEAYDIHEDALLVSTDSDSKSLLQSKPTGADDDEDDDVPLAKLSTAHVKQQLSDSGLAHRIPSTPANQQKNRSASSQPPSDSSSSNKEAPHRSISVSSSKEGIVHDQDNADSGRPQQPSVPFMGRRRSSSSSTGSSMSSRQSSISEIFGSFREVSPLFRTFTSDTATTKTTTPRNPSSLGTSQPISGEPTSPVPYEEPRKPLGSSILPSFLTGGTSLSSSYSSTNQQEKPKSSKRKSASGSQVPSAASGAAGAFSSVFRSLGVPSFGSSSSASNTQQTNSTSTARDAPMRSKSQTSDMGDPSLHTDQTDGIIRAPAVHESPRLDMSPSSAQTDDDDSAFVMARLHAREATAEYDVEAGGPTTTKWISDQLSVRFQFVKESLIGTNQPIKIDSNEDIDWDFWGKVINDYENVVRKQPRAFTKKLHQGIPEPIRGMMWQLMSKSKSEALENKYLELLTGSSRHEKVIQRDLARTFPGHEFFKDPQGPGQTSLFNVLKAYSIYDQEVGYCQGIAFIVGPLLLNMPEEQAFCVLVRLMQDYGFRDLYGPKMIGLQLRNHQFDKLLEEQFPAVFRHLNKQDVKSTMYASQWFMTLFAYRFPLALVFRIMDILFAEGSEAVLRFALALIRHNADTICSLDFEPLLEFLKAGLFDSYVTNTNQLVSDAAAIRISKAKLDRWASEYTEEMRKQSPEVMHAEALKAENRKWYDAYSKLEMNYETLNKEHIDLATRFLEKSMQADQANDRLVSLEEQIKSLKTLLVSDRKFAEEQVKHEMDELAQKNVELIRRNASLQEEIGDLEARLADLSMKYATSMADNDELTRKLDRLRKALGA